MKYRIFLVLLSVSLLLTACGAGPAQSAGGVLRVLAAESFLSDIAQNVAGDRLTVETLLPLGMDPHAYQPTPQDAARLADADVLILNGARLETFLDPALANAKEGQLVIQASAGLTPRPDPQGEHPEGDPHFWLDPNNVIKYVENIRAGLSQVDPAGASTYAANAEKYIGELQSLDAWIRSQVQGIAVERRLLVTNHESLGYFADRYGFVVVGAVIPSISTDASPSAQQMASLIQTIKSSGANTIFLDIGANPELAQQIAAETGANIVADLYLATLSGPDGPAPTYLDMIKYDVTQIVKALK